MSCDPPPKLLHSALAESRLRAAEARRFGDVISK
jgi:hypothetical protein